MQVDTSDPYAGFNSQSTVSAFCNLCFGYLTCGILSSSPVVHILAFFQPFLHLLYHCNLFVPWAVSIPICFLCVLPHKFCTMLWAVLHKYNSNFFTLSYCRTSESHQIVSSYMRAGVGVASVHGDSLQNGICVSKLSANALPYYNT